MRRFAVFVAMLGGIALLVFAGCRNAQERRAAMASTQPQMTITKDGGAVGSGGGIVGPAEDVLRGKAAPNFTLVDTSGHKVSLSELKGKPVVVNFWATWCAPCKLEMPWFEEFSHKYKDSGLVVLGLSQDDDATKADLATAAKRIGVTYPILMPDAAAAKAYGGVDYLPETFYVDRAGTVVEETAGAPSKDEMEAAIRKAIGNGA